jgi:hypothetical protein
LKKDISYIFWFILAAGIVALLITGGKQKKRVADQRISLRRQDKIPYGTYAAYQHLKNFFPNASVSVNRREPGYWDSLYTSESGQTLIAITDVFGADKYELNRLTEFAQNGNDVFISARFISAATDYLLGTGNNSGEYYIPFHFLKDSMRLLLTKPAYAGQLSFIYPGKTFSSFFTSVDTLRTDVLGTDEQDRPNFIHLRAGKGHVYLHLEPLAFSNYFLLHKKNIEYFEKVFSVINPDTKKIVWDEYFLYKKQPPNPREKKGWFAVLMNMKNDAGEKPFRAAFWLLFLLLLGYVLAEMRRKQRYIPVINKPKNDSLDFVRTIGRLYYDKGNHLNLSRKMSAYFLEHVRSRYKLPTVSLDESFILNLKYKSGYDETALRNMIAFIKHLDEAPAISQQQLIIFHRQLESFYKLT